MLIVPGKNSMGNIIHLIIGPETEFFLDVHGANIMNTMPVFEQFNEEAPIFVCYTRCNSEVDTAENLSRSNVDFISSFGSGKKSPDKQETEETTMDPGGEFDNPEKLKQSFLPSPTAPSGDKKSSTIQEVVRGKCTYCFKDSKLLDIEDFNICKSCAKIELGYKQSKRLDKTLEQLTKQIDVNNIGVDDIDAAE